MSRGSGSATKLAINSLVHAIKRRPVRSRWFWRNGRESTAMTAYDVFASGATGAPFLQYKRASFEDPETGRRSPSPSSSRPRTSSSSPDLAAGGRADAHRPATTSEIVRGTPWPNGYAGRDLSAIADVLRERAN